jgi:O-antigen/teichoic acid export membrane protein
VAAAIIGLAVFYFILFRPLRKRATNRSNITKALKTMLKYGVPLSISSLLGGILGQVYAFLMPSFATNTMIGNYQTAMNFSVLLTFLTFPISTVLFPAFAKLDPKKEHQLVKTVFASSTKYASILLVPATLAIMALSGPMIGTLFGEKYIYGPFFLTLYVTGSLLVVFGSLSAGGLLSGLGETKTLLKQSIVTLAIGIPSGLLLIPTLGITGLIAANLLAGLSGILWILYWIWKHYKAKADFQSSAKILAISALAAAATYLPTSLLNTASWIKLIIGLIIFLTVYVLGAPFIGAVSPTDLDNLRTMFSGMGVVSKIINLSLDAAEKVAQIKSAKKKAGEKS